MPDRSPAQVGHGAWLMRDLTAQPINCRRKNSRQYENQQSPITQYIIRGQREKIETQIVTKYRLGAPEWSAMQPLEDDLPIADLRGAHDQSECQGDSGHEQLPRQSIHRQFEQLGQPLSIAPQDSKPAGDARAGRTDLQREQAVHQQNRK